MDTQSTIVSKTGVQKIGRQKSSQASAQNTPDISFKDLLFDSLEGNKHGLSLYQMAINEVMNEDLKNVLLECRDRVQWAQSAFACQLFDIGEYSADLATPPQISDVVDVFNGYRQQLPMKH